jgi:catechol 2,3-dioxygenase-like lactoylglutathione lyase family enzyme
VGITVPADAIQAAREFYGGVLRLPELRSSERSAIFDLGGGELELHVIAGGAADPEAEHHFALEVPDLTAARAQVEGAGYAVAEARPVGGRERIFVRDPFANLLELVSPPASAARRERT